MYQEHQMECMIKNGKFKIIETTVVMVSYLGIT